jgi:hypothetical protein
LKKKIPTEIDDFWLWGSFFFEKIFFRPNFSLYLLVRSVRRYCQRDLWKFCFLLQKKSKTLFFDFFDKKLFGDSNCDLEYELITKLGSSYKLKMQFWVIFKLFLTFKVFHRPMPKSLIEISTLASNKQNICEKIFDVI